MAAAALRTQHLVFTLQSPAPGPVRVLCATEGGRPYALGFRVAGHAKRAALAHDPGRVPRLERVERLEGGARTAKLVMPMPMPMPSRSSPPDELLVRAFPLDSFLMLPSEHGMGVVIVPLTSAPVEAGGRAGAWTSFEDVQVIEPEADATALRRRALARLLNAR